MVVSTLIFSALNWVNTCLPYFKVKFKITRAFASQCSMFTYTSYIYKFSSSTTFISDFLLDILR